MRWPWLPRADTDARVGPTAPVTAAGGGMVATTLGVHEMGKGLDKKKEQKKKPAKTMKEKRAEKSEKKATRGFAPV